MFFGIVGEVRLDCRPRLRLEGFLISSHESHMQAKVASDAYVVLYDARV
jgi:hypothetical protein